MSNRNEQQATFIGPTGSVASFNEADLAYPGQLGSKFRIGKKWYQLVKCHSGAGTPAPGDGIVALWQDPDSYVVTSKQSDAPRARNGVAGVFLMAVTAGNYCIIQIDGKHTNVKTAGSPNAGDVAIANSGTDGDVAGVTAGTAPTHLPVGVFRTTAVTSRSTVQLKLRDNS